MYDFVCTNIRENYECLSQNTYRIGDYAPDSTYDDDEVENFYNILQKKIDNIPKKSTILLIGDFNARVGTDYTESMPEVVGKYSLGEANELGLRLLQFCSSTNMY